MDKNLKICILSEYAYSFFTDRNNEAAGGAELQMTTLARELANNSHDVSLVAFEKSSKSSELMDGVTLYNVFNNQSRGYSYLYPPNLYKLFKVLNKIDADIYIQRATTPLTGVLAFFAKLKNQLFLYSVSSNNDVKVNLSIKTIGDLKKLIYRFGVKNCDCVICQTNNQKNLLKQTINREGKIIKNLYIPPQTKYDKDNPLKSRVLWIGRLMKDKRPELFLKLAENLPNHKFWMIGSVSDHTDTAIKYYNKIKENASKINNLDFIDFVPHKEINRYYANSSLLINTSLIEGFPNTFLEAWGNYSPVVTLDFDPDEIICKYKLGFHSKTFKQMVEDVKILLKNNKLRKEMGINSRRYVEKEHNIKKIIKEYEGLIESLIGGK